MDSPQMLPSILGNWCFVISDWWFGTMEFYDLPFSWECHHPNSLIFFRGVGIPPTRFWWVFNGSLHSTWTTEAPKSNDFRTHQAQNRREHLWGIHGHFRRCFPRGIHDVIHPILGMSRVPGLFFIPKILLARHLPVLSPTIRALSQSMAIFFLSQTWFSLRTRPRKHIAPACKAYMFLL